MVKEKRLTLTKEEKEFIDQVEKDWEGAEFLEKDTLNGKHRILFLIPSESGKVAFYLFACDVINEL